MGAARAAVHGEANPAVRRELASFDLTDRRFHQLTEFLLLLLRDGGLQILNLRQVLADEDNQRNLADATHPGIANQLRVEREKPFGLLGIPAGRRFPVDQMTMA